MLFSRAFKCQLGTDNHPLVDISENVGESLPTSLVWCIHLNDVFLELSYREPIGRATWIQSIKVVTIFAIKMKSNHSNNQIMENRITTCCSLSYFHGVLKSVINKWILLNKPPWIPWPNFAYILIKFTEEGRIKYKRWGQHNNTSSRKYDRFLTWRIHFWSNVYSSCLELLCLINCISLGDGYDWSGN